MEYSPIKALKFKNFRNLEDVVIEFDGHSIITLVGDNEAGKSSISKAMETLGANLKPNTQKDYIRDGASGFLVAAQLDDEDGTIVFRRKDSGFNGFGVQKKGQIVWSTDKMDENSVPPQIKQYMGFILEPETKELLNVRTYENLLLFITTSGSSNYKVMYNALKADNLSKAIKVGTKEANTHKGEINRAETSVETLTEKIRDIRVIDLSALLMLKERLVKEQEALEQLENAEILWTRIKEIDKSLGELKTLHNIELIDEVEAETLSMIFSNLKSLKSIESELKIYKDVSTFKEIDVNEIKMLETCLELLHDITNIKDWAYTESLSVELVNEEEVGILNSLIGLVSEINELDKKYSIYNIDITMVDESDLSIITQIKSGLEELKHLSTLESNMALVDNAINTLETQLKSFGVMVTTCRNCGETVIMEG